ncbi:MAG TPA: glycosyltransferase family 4 protein [Salinivirgaceae bacterium]|nr:glycosyltransferase family 4 protein [Salinivirgaceae bacterium]
MKLLQILYPGLGGHSSVAFSLIEADEECFYNHSLLGFGIEEPSEMFITKANELNVEFENVRKKKGFDFASQKRVYRLLKKQKPNYMIVHNTSLVFVVFLYSLFHKVKWLMVEHQSNHAKTKIDWIYSLFILLLSPKIVYLTELYKSEIKSKFRCLVCDKKIQTIPNGINTKKFYPNEKKLDNKELVFSMISRLTPLRDHKTLIEAVEEVAKTHPCKLYIAGDGDTKPELMEMVKKRKLENLVHFTGKLDEDEVVDLLHKTDIYIHSSLAETLSTSLLQVMACKVPIIATNIKGINNLLIDGKEAMLFEVGDSNRIKSNIIYMVENKWFVDSLIEKSYNKLVSQYNNRSLLRKYMDFIDKKNNKSRFCRY